jgi:CHAT domain-containing protein
MKGRKLIGEEATEAEFKKQAALFDILHFATHTRIDDENPLSSMLSFYPYGGRGEDGILHTYEIYNLDLKGELAVLSACSTGNGKLQKGEGVISLARAFTYAGMPSVMMTLWDVEDISTGNIVPSFYKLLGKGLDKDDALRQSKLNYLKQTKPEIETHPAFWSGFVLYGNSRGFRQKSDHTYIISLLLLGGLIILFSFVIVRKYIFFRKKMRQVDVDLPTEFRPEDGL